MSWNVARFVVALLSITNASAKWTCSNYVPHGQIGNVGVLSFKGFGNLASVPEFNATSTSPVQVTDPSVPGTLFKFQQCTNAAGQGRTVSGYCSDVECINWYGRTIRVIDPVSKLCLSYRNSTLAPNSIEMYFATCSSSEINNTGLWLTVQDVHHGVRFDGNSEPHWTSEYLGSGNATFWPLGSTNTQQVLCDHDCKSQPWYLQNGSTTILAGQQSVPDTLHAVVYMKNWTYSDYGYYNECRGGC